MATAGRQPAHREAGVQSKILSACSGAVVTSLLMTPFDVVKTRQQSQMLGRANPLVPRGWRTAAGSSRRAAAAGAGDLLCRCDSAGGARGLVPRGLDLRATASLCLCPELPAAGAGPGRPTTFFTASADAGRGGGGGGSGGDTWRGLYRELVAQPYRRLQRQLERSGGGGRAAAAAEERITGTLAGMRHIARSEGVRTLWRGLTPTLVASGPSTVIYFVGYDYLRQGLGRWMRGRAALARHEAYASLAAGCTARTVAVAVISPLELVRTRVQAAPAHSVRTVLRDVSHEIRHSGGVRILWRGLVPTLWRDVPFSALYWFGYEQWRAAVYEPLFAEQRRPAPAGEDDPDVFSRLAVAFCSGASSGVVAATLTMPFDVAKTRRQIERYVAAGHPQQQQRAAGRSSLTHVLREIVAAEGPRGLFAGLAPRLMKVVPSCAIMISSYELGKLVLSH
ncbi:Carrier protein, mitochondrial [Coemansia helicoidea]|uniref:Carrier protein, mitochondrial n=1 Tax=Coemansia helicoidea TaxID=1286919 RepID=A0ACC1LHA5_9FUNG|nr:Carrier protein, mitochondrial [Coemansia helicoidea]